MMEMSLGVGRRGEAVIDSSARVSVLVVLRLEMVLVRPVTRSSMEGKSRNHATVLFCAVP